jgi:hypothetical protein
MHPLEKAVRDAATALHGAIIEARAAGFRVDYPTLVDGLPTIAISQTGKLAKADEDAKAKAPKKS